jgi:hypothetical protein
MPPPHVPVRDDQGLTTWRPVLTTLTVHGVAWDHNTKHLVIREDGVERHRFPLTQDARRHLADLLLAEDVPAAPKEAEA